MIDPIPDPSPAVATTAAPPQLTEEHLRQLSDARAAAKKIRRAVAIANFDGWSVGVFGGLSLMFGFIGGIDFFNLIIGAGLVAIAMVELRAAKGLGRLEPQAPKALGYNQLALAGLIIAYSLWRLHAGIASPGDYQQISEMNPEMGDWIKGIVQQISRILYASLILFAIAAQGGLALYYFSRTKLVENYVAQTPEWIISMQKSGVTI